MIQSIIYLATGFVLLIWGAGWLVEGASALAKRLGVSDLVVGLTVVAFGTSFPELTVNTFNSFEGRNDAVFGNIIGSNIFNIAFILGVTGLIRPIVLQRRSVAYEIPFSMLSTLLLMLMVNDQFLGKPSIFSRSDAIVFLLLFASFCVYLFRTASDGLEASGAKTLPLTKVLFLIVPGCGFLIGGGYLATNHAALIALELGMSQKLVGLTILSIGTSLPELVTSAIAASKQNSEIAIGNVVGSNIFNITFILGISGLLNPPVYDPEMNIDILTAVICTAFLVFAMFSGSKMKLDRWEAMVLFGMYIAYMIYVINRN